MSERFLTTHQIAYFLNLKDEVVYKALSKENIKKGWLKRTWDMKLIDKAFCKSLKKNYNIFKAKIDNFFLHQERQIERKIQPKIEAKIQTKEEKAKQIESFSEMIQSQILDKWFQNTDTNYVLHIGPTNSGKTYHAVNRLKEAKNGIYLCPLRLLSFEVFDKLNEEGFPCNLITGEEQIIVDNASFTASTIEMMNYDKEYEVVVVDECFMIGDAERGKSWLKALLESKSKEIHLILNKESEKIITNILDRTNKKYTKKNYKRLTPLKVNEAPFKLKKPLPKTCFITFSRIGVLKYKNYFEGNDQKVSVLYGNLPPEVKKKQIKRFIDGETDVMVSTDVIGMGLNLPCDNVCFLDIEKFDGKLTRRLTPIEIRQIGGRAGRFGKSKVGYVGSHEKHQIEYIKSKIDQDYEIKRSVFGLSYDIFAMFPEDFNVIKRLQFFSQMKVIPDNLKDLVEKETIDRYMSQVDEKLDRIELNHAWNFLTAPVKDGSRIYWHKVLNRFCKNNFIPTPNIEEDFKITGVDSCEKAESTLMEIDIYLYLTNNANFSNCYDKKEKDYVIENKKALIEKIDAFLLKKLSCSKKKCKDCNRVISINYPYNTCENCYNVRFIDFYLRGDY